MVVGALFVARRVAVAGLATATLVAVAVQGAGLGLPTAWLAVGFAGAAWFVGGVGHGTKNTLARTLIQQRVPDRLHGRAFAAYNGIRNSAELIALAAGGADGRRDRGSGDAGAGRSALDARRASPGWPFSPGRGAERRRAEPELPQEPA